MNTNFGFARNFAAGGQLLVDFANNLTYEYTGGTHAVRSNAAISLIQPLLRNAGRRVRLESLTQAERDVLYSVRDFARFRKSFWASVAVGAGGGQFGGGGYLDLLQSVQNLRNAQVNLKQQEETYGLYYELFRGGRRSVVELDQFFQSLQQARLGVIEAELGLENALDGYKLQLGLPPRIPVELDDSLLDQFVLTDPSLEKLRDDLDKFQRGPAARAGPGAARGRTANPLRHPPRAGQPRPGRAGAGDRRPGEVGQTARTPGPPGGRPGIPLPRPHGLRGLEEATPRDRRRAEEGDGRHRTAPSSSDRGEPQRVVGRADPRHSDGPDPARRGDRRPDAEPHLPDRAARGGDEGGRGAGVRQGRTGSTCKTSSGR